VINKRILSTIHHASKCLVIVSVMLMLISTGCTRVESPKTPIPISETPVEEPITPVAEMANPTKNKYDAIIQAYLEQIPEETLTQTPVSEEKQSILVNRMVQLYKEKASTKEIYELYLEGIRQLSPKQGDKFVAYAISGMNNNIYDDSMDLEKIAYDPIFFETFFEEADRVQYKYIELSRDPKRIMNQEVREIVEAAKDQGYYVASSEGMLYYLVDFTVFAKYRNYNTATMATLIEILAFDTLDPMTSDAALIVSGSTLAARTYYIEKKLEEYPSSPDMAPLAMRYKEYMFMLLYGVNNTPTFSYETNRLTDETMSLFEEVKMLEDSYMSESVKEFRRIVEANDGIIDESTRDKTKEIFVKIDKRYGITDDGYYDFEPWMSDTP